MGTVPVGLKGTVLKGVGTGPKGWGQELLGVVIVGIGLVVGWCVWQRRCGLRVTGGDLIGAGVVFGLLAAVVLLHPLTAPNGLGVYAGKAKLWLMSGGIPADFGTNPAYAVLQPAYPPGLTLLALFADKVGGVCGDWLIQLLSAVCGGLLLLTLSVGRERSGWGKLSLVTLPTLAFVLSPIAVRMFSGFYAEPFAALLLVMGARAIGTGRNGLGWTLMGCAALFRTEAAFLAFFFWLFLRLFMRREGECPVASWRGLLSVIGPALLWQVVCRYMGAQVYDFDFTSFPSFARVGSAMLAALGAAFAGCLQNGAVVPLTVVGVLAAWQLSAARNGTRAPRPAVPSGCYAGECLSGNTAALLAVVATVMVGTLILGFNVSSQFDWILRQTMPRFIWLSAAILLVSLYFPSDFATSCNVRNYYVIITQILKQKAVPRSCGLES